METTKKLAEFITATGFADLPPETIRYKFHASCHGTHAPIEAVLALKRDHPLDPVEIRQVDIIVSAPMLEVAGKEKPARGLEGKFSIPYSVANALLSGDTGIAAFTDERVQDAEKTQRGSHRTGR